MCYGRRSFVKPDPAMSNLTISVDEQLIRQARVRAIEQGTSLSAKVREFLRNYVNENDKGLAKQRVEATARLMAAIEAATPRSPAGVVPAAATRGGRRRTLREELYEGDFRGRDRASAKAARTPRDK